MGVLVDFINRLYRKHGMEIIFIICILLSAIVSGILFFKTSSGVQENKPVEDTIKKISTPSGSKITVDISGSVMNPDIYLVEPGTRIKEVLDMAGGLSPEAARVFIYRNVNMARIVTDQEKIYLPSTGEIQSGVFTEKQRYLDYLAPQYSSPKQAPSEGNINTNTAPQKTLVPINTATPTELDTLPGIGKTTAEKIVENRPYSDIQELLNKKIVSQKVFEGIKESIEL